MSDALYTHLHMRLWEEEDRTRINTILLKGIIDLLIEKNVVTDKEIKDILKEALFGVDKKEEENKK